MKRLMLVSLAALVAAQLAACGEKPQTANARKSDEKVWQSHDGTFTAAGYKVGDKAAWDDQARARAQSQNEYTRVK